jgi:peptidyl-dipeptidase A
MDAAAFQAETDRLWQQVEPLYTQLQCYARNRLVEKYGEQGEVDGLIPAHLTGNLWQQDWSNLWPLLEPYAGVGSLDVGAALRSQRDALLAKAISGSGGLTQLTAEQQVELTRQADIDIAANMTRLAEGFYTGLGMPALPDSFYSDSQLVQPRDRDVVCHASAWPMDTKGEVRIKMCIKPTEEELTTIYHELGHIYYFLAYKDLPAIFQNGAHDGFHEAIGDTIVLSMTPEYLASIGLIQEPQVSEQAVINSQMRMALSKVAFLPFGLMIDRWRWGVFDGSITPDNYNAAWWELKKTYQGVAPADARGEEFFDPGAKYHVPGNTPYTRYFLSHILQFQFYKALCDAAGHEGPLYQCNFAGNPEAGQRYWAMLSKGNSQPWQQTLKELTGGEQMDASAVLEYFAPLNTWLENQNQGQDCGWNG